MSETLRKVFIEKSVPPVHFAEPRATKGLALHRYVRARHVLLVQRNAKSQQEEILKTWRDEQDEQREARDRDRLARRAEADAEQRRGFSLRHTSMEDRLLKLIGAMPEDEREQPRPISFFVNALRAKYPTRGRGRASPAEIGPALRALGWRRERKWRAEDQGFRALWIPPTN